MALPYLPSPNALALSMPAAVDLLPALSDAIRLLANASSPTFLLLMLSLSIMPPQRSFSHISLVTFSPSSLAFLIPLSLHVLSLHLLIFNVLLLPLLLRCLSYPLSYQKSYSISIAHAIALLLRIPKLLTLAIHSHPLYLFQRLTHVYLYFQRSAQVCLYSQRPAPVGFPS